jgi:flagellar hook-associated protein 2
VGEAETFSVDADNSATKAALDKFTKAYNALNSFINTNTAYDAETQQGGPLLGDSTLRSLESTLRNTLLASTEGVAGLNTLVDLGLRSSATGSLSREGTALDDALARDPEGINGLLDRLGTTLESRLDRFDGSRGLVAARIDGLETRLDSLDDQRERLNRRMESVQARYQREFSSLDGLIAGMSQTSSYLSAQLSGLN